MVSQRSAAVIRIFVFGTMLVAVMSAQSAGFNHRPLVMAMLVYGAITLGGLLLAWLRFYRAWLPYVFIAMDVVTLAATILLLGRLLGLPPDLAPTLPAAGLVLVVLLHASMHYRPALVVFGAALFIGAMLLGAVPLVDRGTGQSAVFHEVVGDHLLHFRIFPLAIFGLVSVILVATTRRTRRFIGDAVFQSGRAAALSSYFSPEVAEELSSRPEESAMFGERTNVAVLFADLQGFTAMAEGMEPEELARFLSEFRERIARPVISRGGVVDKYIGDAIMVVFGAPKARDDDAGRAIACAIEMAEAMRAWSDERHMEGRSRIGVGIGAHFGRVFAGVLTDGRVREYTVIGDTVNVASRLADLPRSLETPLIVSADLVDAAGGLPQNHRWGRLPPQRLPGHPRLISLFRLEDAARVTLP
jgi:class 3 adenylate cyclase